MRTIGNDSFPCLAHTREASCVERMAIVPSVHGVANMQILGLKRRGCNPTQAVPIAHGPFTTVWREWGAVMPILAFSADGGHGTSGSKG
jgi:hypothetical protein